MPKKLTVAEREAEERQAVRRHERERAKGRVVMAAIASLRPSLEIAYICGEAPRWFESIIWKCKIEAGSDANRDVCYHDAAFRGATTDEAKRVAYHEAYMPAFAEAFARLLGRALVKQDAA